MKCIFCDIVKKNIPAEIIEEDDLLVVFKDINPKAPIHLLIVPKNHFASVNEVEDQSLLGAMILKAKTIAQKIGTGHGYKLVFNVGRAGGQVIDHLHLHLLGGWQEETHRVEV